MIKPHSPSSYQDGHVRVEFCKVCGAEGLKLLEDCPQKVTTDQNYFKKVLDEKELTSK